MENERRWNHGTEEGLAGMARFGRRAVRLPLLCERHGFMLFYVPYVTKCVPLALAGLAVFGGSNCFSDATKLKVKTTLSTNSPAHSGLHTNRLAREKSPYLLQHQ